LCTGVDQKCPESSLDTVGGTEDAKSSRRKESAIESARSKATRR